MRTKGPLDFFSLTIPGERIKLVPLATGYAEVIFEEFTDEITRYMVPATPSSIEEVHEFIRSSIDNMHKQTDLTLAVLKKADDEFLGVCGLHGRVAPDEPVLGIWLKKSAHGHRYGREAIARLVDWARKNVVFEHMVYPCDKDNVASRKVAEAVGGCVFRTGKVKSMSGRVLNEIAYKIV